MKKQKQQKSKATTKKDCTNTEIRFNYKRIDYEPIISICCGCGLDRPVPIDNIQCPKCSLVAKRKNATIKKNIVDFKEVFCSFCKNHLGTYIGEKVVIEKSVCESCKKNRETDDWEGTIGSND